MSEIIALRDALRPHLGWHGARLAFVSTFLIALFRVKTVNFAELATAFVGGAQIDSNDKRLQRFFRHFELDYRVIARTVMALIDIPQPWVLSLDRTEWQFGQTTYNILVLGVVHQGVAFPVVWTFLDKRGNSNTQERIDLIEQFLAVFPSAEIAYLAADREFLGQDWFRYLLRYPSIAFRIRIRESEKLGDGQQSLRAAIVFQNLRVGQSKTLGRCLWGCWVFVAALRLEDGSLLIVATMHSPTTAIRDYANRWSIETLFSVLKTRGFCLESTHLSGADRVSKLVALLALALCWAHRTAAWLAQQRPIKIKPHGRKARSIFRTGFDHLRRVFVNLDQFKDEFLLALQFLSCT